MASKTVRLQFEISEILAREIEELEQEAEIGSHREFFANLVGLWRWAARRSREGKAICALDLQSLKYNELTHPSLDFIKMKALGERELALVETTEADDKDSCLTITPE